jgi:tRNA (guanine26-N2/guanine27-N2)-dimethyltransferase
VSKRRYGATPLNNHFAHETAIRILAGVVARVAASVDIGGRPVAAHSTRHYIRLFFSIETGATRGDSALGNLGHVSWCPSCGNVAQIADPRASCEKCGKKARSAGPVWVGSLTDVDLLRRAKGKAEEAGLQRAAGTFAALLGVDRFPPWSFSLAAICSKLGVATVSESEIFESLKESGYGAMRSPFEKSGIKTDADYEAISSSVRSSLKSARAGDAL